MSIFTANSVIERLEDEVESLKLDNEILKERLLGMTKQHTETRKAKDVEIAALKAEIKEGKDLAEHLGQSYTAMKRSLDEILDARDAEIVRLKEQLDAEVKQGNARAEHLYQTYASTKSSLNAILDARDAEIAELKAMLTEDAKTMLWYKEELSDAATENTVYKQQVAALKKELEDNRKFIESAIERASQTESELFLKNVELHGRLNMIAEESEQQALTIRNMEEQLDSKEKQICDMKEMCSMVETMSYKVYKLGDDLTKKENELTTMLETNQKQAAQLLEAQNELERAHKKLACIMEASTYITKILAIEQ